ncbi:hypothetical protein PYW08_011527 [Mythimna loreyi]|uniref:Uncharacterized protein n=1 Tax=Mythimna loreyi TaxID=667449 RepID=A0ACC2QKS1_9NEOP|nr:hypothetical protein PYW08_011527 [Mythimna loreyi]
MDIKTGFLVITLLVGCFAAPTPEDDMSIFFDHTDFTALIVGGTEAAAGSHPHMVAMTTGLSVRSLVCGGSLITQRTVLTAAHCIIAVMSGGSLTSTLRVTVGTNRWNSGGQTYALHRHIIHGHNVPSIVKNDIGLLITSTLVALNNQVRTVPITYAFIGGGVASTVAGWGRTSTGGPLSDTLLELRSTTLTGNDCVQRVQRAAVELNFRVPPVDPNLEVCTYHSPGFGTCNGDSGSALRRSDNGQQFGIVSWGLGCARGAPDVYVRLSSYQSWLNMFVVS